MTSFLITGCNRGLGLGLVKQLLIASKPSKYILATCRNPSEAKVNPTISIPNQILRNAFFTRLKKKNFHAISYDVHREIVTIFSIFYIVCCNDKRETDFPVKKCLTYD